MSRPAWRRAGRPDLPALEAFLRGREGLAVGLVGRLLREGRLRFPNPLRGGLWIRAGLEGPVEGALLAHPARVFYPQLPAEAEGDAELAALLAREGGRPASIIGPAGFVERLEAALRAEPLVRVPYRLLSKPEPGFLRLGPPRGLDLARAGLPELEETLPLQEAYEREEVLTPAHRFDPAGCRAALARSLSEQLLLLARLEGRPVGKAGTNARSFSLDQIGGVFVLPELRGRGIGRALMELLLEEIEGEGRRASLFVKTGNAPALGLYASLGFREIGDFRADYFEA